LSELVLRIAWNFYFGLQIKEFSKILQFSYFNYKKILISPSGTGLRMEVNKITGQDENSQIWRKPGIFKDVHDVVLTNTMNP
jgi:hypothetical protein